ncbi:MAG TPA: OsmC family protein [Polyangiaceae bacterium]|nr:OsmC family protein [Polyangiaceae bacterium]
MKALIESAGGVASRVRIGSHDIVFDQPSPVPGGEDKGPSPLDVMTISVGACAHYFASAFLYGRKLSTDGLRVEVEWIKSKEPAPRISQIVVHVMLPVGVPEHYLPGIERAVKNCPAYGTLVHPPEVQLTVAKEEPVATAPAA